MTEKDPSSLKLRWTGISQRFGASRSALRPHPPSLKNYGGTRKQGLGLRAWGSALPASDFAQRATTGQVDPTRRPDPPSLKLRRDTQAGHTVKSKKCKGRSIFLYSNDIYLLVCYQKLNSYPFTRRRFKI
jgi:hypothetical protein